MNLLPFTALLLATSLAGAAPAAIPVDDEKIFLAVEGDLRGAGSLSGTDIKVETRQGIVTLSGVARTVEQIATAGRIAGRAHGVTGVHNYIRIDIRPWRG